jgi:hypothetical protein
MLKLLLAGLLELLMLGPRIWRVQLLGRRALPYSLLLLLQGRRRRSSGCGHGLVKGRRGIGTLLAACIVDVSTRYGDMAATAHVGTSTTGHTSLGKREGAWQDDGGGWELVRRRATHQQTRPRGRSEVPAARGHRGTVEAAVWSGCDRDTKARARKLAFVVQRTRVMTAAAGAGLCWRVDGERQRRCRTREIGEDWDLWHRPAAGWPAGGAAGWWHAAGAAGAAASAARQKGPGGTGSGILSGSSWTTTVWQ